VPDCRQALGLVLQSQGQEGFATVAVSEADTPEIIGRRGGDGPFVHLPARSIQSVSVKE
jgi:hypothetical protein